MNIEEARLYLEHTSKNDFNLEEHQKENRYQAIQVVLEEIERLNNIIKEVREQINKDRKKYDYEKDGLMKQAFYCNKTDKLLEILDKVGSDKE